METDYCHRDMNFWMEVIGNEGLSVFFHANDKKIVSGNIREISSIFRIDKKISLLKFLDIFGFVSVSKNKRNNIYNVTALNRPPVPGWSQFIMNLSKAIEIDTISKKRISDINWSLVSARLDEETNTVSRVGLGYLESVGIFTNSSKDSKRPFIVVNNDQKVTCGGYQTLTIGPHSQCIFAHKINVDRKNEVGIIDLKDHPVDLPKEKERTVTVKSIQSWKHIPVEKWNANHFAHWICDKFQESYEVAAPFNPVGLVQASIKNNGIMQLARVRGISDEDQMRRDYKEYVEWLIDHRKLAVTPNTLTSVNIMINYVAEISKQRSPHKTGLGTRKAYNMKDSDYE